MDGIETPNLVSHPIDESESSASCPYVQIDDETPLNDLGFLSSHNSFQGRMQVIAPPSLKHLVECLVRKCRAIELDVYSDKRGNPIVRHAWCFGGLPWSKVLDVIALHAFRDTGMPLVIFVDVRASASTMTKAAIELRNTLGSRLMHVPSLDGLTLGQTRNKVLVVSYPPVRDSIAWTSVVSDSMYRRGFFNRNQSESLAKEDTEGLRSHFWRVYPRNVFFSKNFDPTQYVGRAHFVALNWGVRNRTPVERLEQMFEGSEGILPLKVLQARAQT